MIFRAQDRQSHLDSRATLPCKSQVRLTRDKCSKQIQFCSVPRTLHVRAAGADCLCNWGSNRSAYCWPAENKHSSPQRVRPVADLKRANLSHKWFSIISKTAQTRRDASVQLCSCFIQSLVSPQIINVRFKQLAL